MKDGMLWKVAIKYEREELQQQAVAFINGLQEDFQPADWVQGTLLDRMASAYLRKLRTIRCEAAIMESSRLRRLYKLDGPTPEIRALDVDARGHSFCYPEFPNMLKFEAFLDQAFHRDFILLQQMKQAALAASGSPDKTTNTDEPVLVGETLKSNKN